MLYSNPLYLCLHLFEYHQPLKYLLNFSKQVFSSVTQLNYDDNKLPKSSRTKILLKTSQHNRITLFIMFTNSCQPMRIYLASFLFCGFCGSKGVFLHDRTKLFTLERWSGPRNSSRGIYEHCMLHFESGLSISTSD